ncbi:short-chain dehydrogenase [Providencia heimbachae]|uniref:SDR family NAD(P)-dependent oxidoreductase n=1 Tax=Providencia heimbachae TaxID=333962 RepID=UPI0010BF5F8C|nr:SDR family NAD(P)-dependent oxidoreductase [Providencia heimbachae]QCJ70601.1 short-chain dehydrogenase [Providencia heimbachae]
MITFQHQVVLVTGGARGLGLAYVRCIAKLGAVVFIQDIGADSQGNGSDPTIAQRSAQMLQAEGFDVRAITGSLSSREECHQLVKQVIQQAGQLNAVIHNAGWVAYQPIEQLEEEAFDHMLSIATKAPLWLAQAAWPTMKSAGYGRIVVTTSCRALYGQYAQIGLAAYAAAKMAIVGAMNILNLEGEKHGIIVNAVSPVAKTRMWGIEDEPNELHPADVAPGVAFLASSACQSGGWILRAANGQFHATKALEAEHVDYPRNIQGVSAKTAQDVVEQWSKIAITDVEPRK